MANLKKCDRCERPYDPVTVAKNIDLYDNWWRFSLRKDCYPYEEIKIDLCPDCRKDLYSWFKNK